MILTFAIIGAILWFIFIFTILWLRQSPEAKLRKRLNEMIDEAEAKREREATIKKNMIQNIAGVSIDSPLFVIMERETFYNRVIRPILNLLDKFFQNFAPNAIRRQLEEKIFRAGKSGSWSVSRLITIWCISIGMFTFLAVMLLQKLRTINAAQEILFIGLGVFIGAVIPFAVLNSKIRKRQEEIRSQLPEFLDILCVSVQAGLSFDSALVKITKRMKGALIDEFTKMQNDVSLGMTHQYALTVLARRCDLEEVYLFTTSIIQAERLGTSMARTLSDQADNMRERHKQRIKAKALKAPVKILFPMVMFIFPSMFIVLLFPTVYSFLENFGKR